MGSPHVGRSRDGGSGAQGEQPLTTIGIDVGGNRKGFHAVPLGRPQRPQANRMAEQEQPPVPEPPHPFSERERSLEDLTPDERLGLAAALLLC